MVTWCQEWLNKIQLQPNDMFLDYKKKSSNSIMNFAYSKWLCLRFVNSMSWSRYIGSVDNTTKRLPGPKKLLLMSWTIELELFFTLLRNYNNKKRIKNFFGSKRRVAVGYMWFIHPQIDIFDSILRIKNSCKKSFARALGNVLRPKSYQSHDGA